MEKELSDLLFLVKGDPAQVFMAIMSRVQTYLSGLLLPLDCT